MVPFPFLKLNFFQCFIELFLPRFSQCCSLVAVHCINSFVFICLSFCQHVFFSMPGRYLFLCREEVEIVCDHKNLDSNIAAFRMSALRFISKHDSILPGQCK